jgi:hypothetical protein
VNAEHHHSNLRKREELRIFDPLAEPYLSFSSSNEFLNDEAIQKGIQYLATGTLSKDIMWPKFGKPRPLLSRAPTDVLESPGKISPAPENPSNGVKSLFIHAMSGHQYEFDMITARINSLSLRVCIGDNNIVFAADVQSQLRTLWNVKPSLEANVLVPTQKTPEFADNHIPSSPRLVDDSIVSSQYDAYDEHGM